MSRQSTTGIMAAAALSALLCLPINAQDANSPAPSAAQATAPTTNPNAPAEQDQTQDQTAQEAPAQARPPLQAPVRQGFWGRMNPFARKKYVEGQLSPIRDRANELDGLTAANAKAINDVDARAKAGLAAANEKVNQASQTASAAQQQVQQDSDQANQLNQQVQSTNTKLQSVDQYQVAQSAELNFKPGPATLSASAQQQLDSFLQGLDGQTGYIIEVTAYTPRKGLAGLTASQDLADTVVRYMVLQHNVPLYRIYTAGMGNATAPSSSAENSQMAAAQMPASRAGRRATTGGTVQIRILKNSLASEATPAS